MWEIIQPGRDKQVALHWKERLERFALPYFASFWRNTASTCPDVSEHNNLYTKCDAFSIQFKLLQWFIMVIEMFIGNKNTLILLQHLCANVAFARPPAQRERKFARDWWVWLNKDKILNLGPYVCRTHRLSWLGARMQNLFNILMSSSAGGWDGDWGKQRVERRRGWISEGQADWEKR